MLNQQHTTQTQTIGKYRVIRTLGTGLFKVKLVFDPVSSHHYAAKICKYSLKKTILEREATLLHELTDANIPNIVQYVDYIDITKINNQINHTSMISLQNFPELNNTYKSALIIEYAPNDTIFDIIYHTGKLEPKLARTYFKKLVETISTLHSKGYVHRDLKPENLLLDQNFQLKLADFGFARSFSSYNKDRMTTKLGTEAYMAPEMLASRTYSGIKVDSFACGVLLFLFSFGRPPFYNASSGDTLYKHFIQESPEKFWEVYEEKLNDGKVYDKDLKMLISDLLKYNPKERLEVGKAEEYEWLKGEVYSDEELVKMMEPLKATADQGIKNLKK